MPPLPAGFRVELDDEVRWLDDSTLFAGSPARILRFSPAGRRAVRELADGPVAGPATAAVARRLTDAGAAHPCPPAVEGSLDVTVLIPVRDRVAELDRCLSALGRRYPVLVVDDGSSDPDAVAGVAAAHRAQLVRHDRNQGPAAARNSGLAALSSSATTELVALLDSDCEAGSGWIAQLAGHFSDPLVAAAAPRVRAAGRATVAGRYTAACSSLDLGPRPARVAPLGRVSYVPTAALLVRRSALPVGGPFDEALRYGEDVDLLWRLHDAGWRIRYDPAAEVRHHDPDTLLALLIRRFRYGTSAGQLARRHPGYVPPLALAPWSAAVALALLARRPDYAAGSYLASVLALRARVRRAGIPATGSASAMLVAARQSWLGIGTYATQFAAPVLLAAVAVPGGRRTRWRRLAAASLLVGPAAAAWSTRRPALDPGRFMLAHIADDIAYGAGVWTGSLRARTWIALTPVLAAGRPLGIHAQTAASTASPPPAPDLAGADRPGRSDGKPGGRPDECLV